MATVDATVGGASANSYLTVDEAEVILETSALYTTWDTTNPVAQGNALIRASRMLDEYIEWYGDIVTDEQAMRWPRKNAVDPDGRTIESTVIPPAVKQGAALLAVELLVEDRQAERDDTGLHSVGVGGAVSVTFDKRDKKKVIPERVRSVLRAYGSISGFNTTSRVVRG